MPEVILDLEVGITEAIKNETETLALIIETIHQGVESTRLLKSD